MRKEKIKKLVEGLIDKMEERYRSFNLWMLGIEDQKSFEKRERKRQEMLYGMNHSVTDQHVRTLASRTLMGQTGLVTIAVKSWHILSKEGNVPGINGKYKENLDQRYLFNNEDNQEKMIPKAFIKQKAWEEQLIPGKLYRTTREIRMMPSWTNTFWASRGYVVEKGTILFLISTNEPEMPCKKTGNYTTKFAPGLGDSYALHVTGSKVAEKKIGYSFTQTSVWDGMFGSHDFDNLYFPIVKQRWLFGEQIFEWSFTYDELEEVLNNGKQ